VYITNISPISGKGVTPFEALYSRMLNMKGSKFLSCTGYLTIAWELYSAKHIGRIDAPLGVDF
jgi:hypothetical protein